MNPNKFSGNPLSDDQLSQVSGGGSFRKKGDSNYASGEFPAFTPGDEAWIIYDRGFFRKSALCRCEVLSVNAERGGVVFTEFVYTVRIISVPSYASSSLVGQIVENVYESAISIKIAE